MSDRFEVFRLSLLPRPQRDLESGADPTREEYLRTVFSAVTTFMHYNAEFHFRPDDKLSTADALIGRLGRAVIIDENRPPDQGFEEISHDGWKACVVVVDPRDHEDGQKASIEIDAAVGKPTAIFTGLVKAINAANPLAAYTIEAQPIFDADTFWEFAEENAGRVTTLTFEFVVPNGLWSASSNIRDELKAAKEKLGAQKVINTFQSDEGLETNSEQVKEAVDYAVAGSGEIKARAKGGKKFNSTEKPKVATLPKSDDKDEPIIVRVARNIARVLGRE